MRGSLRRRSLAGVLVIGALLSSNVIAPSAADLQGQIESSRSAASTLQSQIATQSQQIAQTSSGLQDARRRLAALQAQLHARVTQLRRVQDGLIAARDHLVALENRLRLASNALAENLRTSYERSQPDVVTVALESRGFTDLLERVSFLQRIAQQDAQVVSQTRTARVAVAKQAAALAILERRDRALADEVLGQRNQVAALQAALLHRQIAAVSARETDRSKLAKLNNHLQSLEAKAAAQAARSAASGNAGVGGIAVNTGGMVQAPPGAPAAVAQVIAAGNAIATLPYVWGGGHGSFHASGYDCSGSVSYALAAAGLLSSPLDSTGFESWGEPGPGRWITVYANADHAWMEVAGWRFDTVALSSGTRWSQSGGEYSGFVVRHPPGL
ncbi:MAG: hypothetical protein JOZ73_07385 [Solirubrobacterales bacterium]|nr:hypothetical protein [Solirubrobacterales bacterium]